MSKIKIIKTYPGDETFFFFDKVLENIYPPGIKKENIQDEYFFDAFVIFDNEKPVGRAALYLNPYLFYEEKICACIGNYECVNDENISAALINAACEEAEMLGVEFVVGPMNGSTWD